MSPPPITSEQLVALPPEVRAVVQAIIDHYERRIGELTAEVERLKKTHRNSSLPPSSEHPHAKPLAEQKSTSKRKWGGQPGHERRERALIPTEQCQQVVPVKPTRCRRCGRKLCGHNPAPLRHQVWDIPPIEPHVSLLLRGKQRLGLSVADRQEQVIQQLLMFESFLNEFGDPAAWLG
jgi:transposase